MISIEPANSVEKKNHLSGFLLEKTAKLMKLSFSRLLLLHPEIDITVDQWIVVQLLKKHQTLNQQQIAELSFKDAPTVTRILDLLVTKGYVTRIVDAFDRRKFSIELTQSGVDIYEIILPLVNEFRAESYHNVSNEELKILESVLNKIFDNLSKNN